MSKGKGRPKHLKAKEKLSKKDKIELTIQAVIAFASLITAIATLLNLR